MLCAVCVVGEALSRCASKDTHMLGCFGCLVDADVPPIKVKIEKHHC